MHKDQRSTMIAKRSARCLLLSLLGATRCSARTWVDVVDPRIYVSAIADPSRAAFSLEMDPFEFGEASPSFQPTTAPFANIPELPPAVESVLTAAPVLTSSPSASPDKHTCADGEFGYVIRMHDSWGDGWGEAKMTIVTIIETSSGETKTTGSHTTTYSQLTELLYGEQIFEGSLESGTDGYFDICLEIGKCYDVSVEGDQWQDEVKWDIRPVDALEDSSFGTLAKGIAPMKCQFSIPDKTTGDQVCTFSCETAATETPTNSPTTTPLNSPTTTPSNLPAPTEAPTKTHSFAPSDGPSLVPYALTSPYQSGSPKYSETPMVAKNSDTPSDAPSMLPTSAPSDAPSMLFTSTPSSISANGRTGGTSTPTLMSSAPTINPTGGNSKVDDISVPTSTPSMAHTSFDSTYWPTETGWPTFYGSYSFSPGPTETLDSTESTTVRDGAATISQLLIPSTPPSTPPGETNFPTFYGSYSFSPGPTDAQTDTTGTEQEAINLLQLLDPQEAPSASPGFTGLTLGDLVPDSVNAASSPPTLHGEEVIVASTNFPSPQPSSDLLLDSPSLPKVALGDETSQRLVPTTSPTGGDAKILVPTTSPTGGDAKIPVLTTSPTGGDAKILVPTTSPTGGDAKMTENPIVASSGAPTPEPSYVGVKLAFDSAVPIEATSNFPTSFPSEDISDAPSDLPPSIEEAMIAGAPTPEPSYVGVKLTFDSAAPTEAIPTLSPSEDISDAPSDLPTSIEEEMIADAPTPEPSYVGVKLTFDSAAPTEAIPTLSPSEDISDAPSDLPTWIEEEMIAGAPTPEPSYVGVKLTFDSAAPTEAIPTLSPSENISDAPSDLPSSIEEEMIADAPTPEPSYAGLKLTFDSEVPTEVTSDFPSTDSPSKTSTSFWQDLLSPPISPSSSPSDTGKGLTLNNLQNTAKAPDSPSTPPTSTNAFLSSSSPAPSTQPVKTPASSSFLDILNDLRNGEGSFSYLKSDPPSSAPSKPPVQVLSEREQARANYAKGRGS